ncbi:MAG TPA: terminase family protein [Caulobacteraceae bacterium]|nr:terminase family protein [Caulobacteraceae bacterium]
MRPPADSPEALLLHALEDDHAPQTVREAWLRTARPEQITPPGDWETWLLLAGRGFGKSFALAHDGADFGLRNPGVRIAVVTPTFSDGRDVMFEGVSGLLSVIPQRFTRTWNRSMGDLILTNGSRFKLFSSEEPDRLRGPQHHRALCDELAVWSNLQATWDMLQMGLRLGQDPRCVVATTPKPIRLLRELMASPTTVISRGSTYDNAANLAPSALARFKSKYEGTRLGRQELEGELLEDVQGALWTRAMIEDARPQGPTPAMQRIVVAVDPSGSDGSSGDAQGIIVAGKGYDGRGYVLEDATVRASPEQWAASVASLYRRYRADRVVAEKNYGGAMVEAVIRAAQPDIPVTMVSATRGKHIRAEPISALYEQKRITHASPFPELEDELVLMTLSGYAGGGSPNRLDAMVWALTDLLVEDNFDLSVWEELGRQAEAGL